MRVLVTGAAGFIGSHLVDHLLARGDHVYGIDNFDPYYSPAEKRANLAEALANPRFCLVEGDITDARTVDRAFGEASPDAVVHLAAKVGVRPSLTAPAEYQRVNCGGTETVLGGARQAGVRAFVFASSSSVYGNTTVPFSEDQKDLSPISPYAISKLEAEEACRAHQSELGGSMLCLRFFTAYGPRQRPDLAVRKFAALLAAGRPIPVFGNGSSERDYTWIDDIVGGVLAAIDRSVAVQGEFEVINLGSGRTVRLDRLTELLSQILRVPLHIDRLPSQSGDVTRTLANISKAERLLGYNPQTSLGDGTEHLTAKALT